MRAIDTNVLVRAFVRDDDDQARKADEYIARGVWVSHLVLAETLWVLRAGYDHDRAALAGVIEKLLNHATIVVEGADVISDALETFRSNKRVEFSDCLILGIAHRAGHRPLGTFDRDLSKLDGVERLDKRP